ncbi:protein NipSnap homolog 3A-like [Mercenaria mercenaria]|uniref:protein NipSnap homolog 3A-like n=1 Tax=Mercenaria mercenaria TaxID=6596 RepID=UPI00234ECD2D|nr:protein NipSnap homolog 3A-like [Mercenaria mercenaria]
MLVAKTARGFQKSFGFLSILQEQTCKKCFSATNKKFRDKVYELRTYSINPKDIKPFMELSKEWMHIRMKHSKLIGYWLSEIGGINDVVHIWEYDSLSHRAKVRQALAGDPEWVGNYFSKILPWMHRQENSLLKCLPGTAILDPPSNGVYESQAFVSTKGRDETTTAIRNIHRPSAMLLGSWYSILGYESIGFMLWHHPDVDNLVHSSETAAKDSGVTVVHSRLLLPTPWSPMK